MIPTVNHRTADFQFFEEELLDTDRTLITPARPSGAQTVNESLQDSFADETERRQKYRYVFFSPSLEIFKRIDQVLSTMPFIQENVVQYQLDKEIKRQMVSKAKK